MEESTKMVARWYLVRMGLSWGNRIAYNKPLHMESLLGAVHNNGIDLPAITCGFRHRVRCTNIGSLLRGPGAHTRRKLLPTLCALNLGYGSSPSWGAALININSAERGIDHGGIRTYLNFHVKSFIGA